MNKITDQRNDLLSWFLASGIITKEGAVLSWLNQKKPGYPYDEITGYATKLFSLEFKKTGSPLVKEIALKTARYVANKKSIGRDQHEYIFDLGIVLSGLLSARKYCDTKEFDSNIHRIHKHLCENLTKRICATENGHAISDDSKWSLYFGPLMLKMSIPLLEYEYQFGISKRDLWRSYSHEIIEKCFEKQTFYVSQSNREIYTHPHCYALEGLWVAHTAGVGDYKNILDAGTAWLAENQNKDGSVYNWYQSKNKQEKNADCTIQSARLWLCWNSNKYASNIKQTIHWAKDLRKGGICYNPHSEDENAWVTMFFIQLLEWYKNTPVPLDLV